MTKKDVEKVVKEESFKDLLEKTLPVQKGKKASPLYKRGDCVKAQVIKVESDTLWFNLNAQTEGRMHLDNYTNDQTITSFKGLVKAGDFIEAVILKVQDEPAMILLSRLPLLKEKSQEQIINACREQTPVEVLIKDFNKGGFVGSYAGIEVFIPYSNLDYEYTQNKEEYKGKQITCLISDVTFGQRAKVIATRRPIFEKERQDKIENERALAEAEYLRVNAGDILEGEVVNIKPYGATIKFEHLRGILRISQISHHRIDDINNALKLNQVVKVKVIKKENNRLDLSMKALQETPFAEFIKNHQVGDTLTGTINQKMNFGFFIEVSKSVKGLLHRSEFSWDPKDNFGFQAKIGEEVEVKIVGIEPEKEQISLSRKALIDNPWANVDCEKGANVEATIEVFEDDKVIISALGVNGYIRNDEMDLKKGKPEQFYQVGEKIKAKVKYVNKNAWILELSVKRYNAEALERDLEKANSLESKPSKKTK